VTGSARFYEAVPARPDHCGRGRFGEERVVVVDRHWLDIGG